MIQQLQNETAVTIFYPDSDGQPISDNTKQFCWIVIIKENLEIFFANIADIFVASDLLWYPVEGNNKICQAPDAMVVFGRPKGDSPEATLCEQGSDKQWEEANITPQVVFEILSPGNRVKDLTKKLLFYQQYGVEEYYIYDPNSIELRGLLRSENPLEVIKKINSWVSPRLGISFQLKEDTLEIYRLDGERFLTSVELAQLRLQEKQEKELAHAQAKQERQRAEEAEAKAQHLVAKLREMGIDPSQLE